MSALGTPTFSTVLCLCALFVCGCSRGVPLGEVEGTLQMNGSPLADAMVTFIPEDRRLPQSTGISNAEGHFELRCNNGALGAAVGDHRVTVIDATGARAGKSKDDDELPEGSGVAPSRVPQKYTRPDKTPLRQSVSDGSQNMVLGQFELISEKSSSPTISSIDHL